MYTYTSPFSGTSDYEPHAFNELTCTLDFFQSMNFQKSPTASEARFLVHVSSAELGGVVISAVAVAKPEAAHPGPEVFRAVTRPGMIHSSASLPRRTTWELFIETQFRAQPIGSYPLISDPVTLCVHQVLQLAGSSGFKTSLEPLFKCLHAIVNILRQPQYSSPGSRLPRRAGLTPHAFTTFAIFR